MCEGEGLSGAGMFTCQNWHNWKPFYGICAISAKNGALLVSTSTPRIPVHSETCRLAVEGILHA